MEYGVDVQMQGGIAVAVSERRNSTGGDSETWPRTYTRGPVSPCISE